MDLPVVMTLLVAAVVLAVLAGAAAVALGVALSRTRRDQQELSEQLASGRAEQAALRARLDGLAVAHAAGPGPGQAPRPTTDDSSDFVITTLPTGAGGPGGSGRAAGEPGPDRPFVTVAAGESLVRAATLVQGLRRALSAESRNRIRFEMTREVKRSRKQRRRDLRDARRRPAGPRVRPLEEDAA